MRSFLALGLLLGACAAEDAAAAGSPVREGLALLGDHCGACHAGADPQGGFRLQSLAGGPSAASVGLWTKSLEYVRSEFMPPPALVRLSPARRREIVHFLAGAIRDFRMPGGATRAAPRRLNNRELANSVRDALMIEDVGTHQPMATLLGDTRQDGFDTDGEALGMSQYHLEQYIDAFRRIVDATVLSGEPPEPRRILVTADDMRVGSLSQRRRAERANRTPESIDLLDPNLRVHFSNFETAPLTGRYRMAIRAAGMDHGVYDSAETGIYDGDPIRLRVHLGDRVRTFDLPDGDAAELRLDEWIAAGTRLELSYPTDGLRLRGNKNFKFQFSIAHDHLLQHDPERHARVLRAVLPKAPQRTARSPRHWSHWTGQWQGPRPRLFGAEIEGPFYESWPPRRQVALLGKNPTAANAPAVLRPIARRAWRREVRDGELDAIVQLARARGREAGDIEGLKEGIVAILASPAFLYLNPGDGGPADRFASKLSYFLRGTLPDDRLRAQVHAGRLHSFPEVRAEVRRQLDRAEAGEFLREFPRSWLELDRINFMAPDPDRFPLYDRKRLSEDMTREVLRFFRHVVEANRPVTELLSADYSFLNADLARVYGVENVPQDSQLRQYVFADGRRGGLLGMGAFLTLTADSLSTSPIHRAVYVMEKFLGIHPLPPPPDVAIEEPDVRQAKTIKQVLAAHAANAACASCHAGIDPYGYAFENFDPVGAWREAYTMQIATRPPSSVLAEIQEQDRQRAAVGLPPVPKPWTNKPIPVDAASALPDGRAYRDITEYRQHFQTEEYRDRFVRCFIVKLLTYANGSEPDPDIDVEQIIARSASAEYRIIDTISAVIDSPLFREN